MPVEAISAVSVIGSNETDRNLTPLIVQPAIESKAHSPVSRTHAQLDPFNRSTSSLPNGYFDEKERDMECFNLPHTATAPHERLPPELLAEIFKLVVPRHVQIYIPPMFSVWEE